MNFVVGPSCHWSYPGYNEDGLEYDMKIESNVLNQRQVRDSKPNRCNKKRRRQSKKPQKQICRDAREKEPLSHGCPITTNENSGLSGSDGNSFVRYVKYVPPKRKPDDIFDPVHVSDFRTMSLFPRPEDVFGQQPFLHPNIVEGPYGSVDHYLDIHFKLLREDFMGPIRQALRNYKAQCNTKSKFKQIDNVIIYRKVKFQCLKITVDKVCYEVCFDVDKKCKQVNWECSKSFMSGSLLLFTSDHFNTFFGGTVANSNVKELKRNSVSVELEELLPNNKSVLGREFVMAESKAFFLPYFHVLKTLQILNSLNFPLAKYIVDVNIATCIPKYLKGNDIARVQYTVKGANKYFTFNILDDEDWPSCEHLGLDISQYKAYKAALTNDMVVIQGPPGTGKTFIGLEIAKTLLHNSHYWLGTQHGQNTPFLVVCFTNHALDQFLEGLLSVTDKIIRMGGGGKESKLEEFNMKERRKECSFYSQTNLTNVRRLKKQMSGVFAEINVLQTYLQTLDGTGDGILSLKTLGLVSNYIKMSFANDDNLLLWLLVGAGITEQEVNVTMTTTGIIRGTQMTNPTIDPRVRQALFDLYNLDFCVKAPEDFKVYFAFSIANIQKKQEQINKELHINMTKYDQAAKLNSVSKKVDGILKYLKKMFLQSNLPCSMNERERLLNVRDLHCLSSNDRWKLYFIWVSTLQTGIMKELKDKEAQYREYAQKYEQLRRENDLEILKRSHVVGTTTTHAAQHQSMFSDLAPKIVFVEEAAEVLEAHIVASLSKNCQHLIMIGDHKQLRPSVADNRLASHLDVSLFERMLKNNMSCHVLTLQHRMRPEISKQLVPTIYPELRNHFSVMEREHIKGMEKNVFFMMHKHFEKNVEESVSKHNPFEASMILNLAKYLVLQGYSPEEITILATYKDQIHYMKTEILQMNDFPKEIHLTQVDSFQGEENKIILLSLVRSNAKKQIGFLSIENRVCVALSRARDGFYIFGNMDILVSRSKLWCHINDSLKGQNAIGPHLQLRCQNHPHMITPICSVADFRKVSHGGCSLICGQALPCGHKCKSLCHLEKEYHQRYKCKEKCLRILCQYGHQCQKECHIECGKCHIITQHRLPCGHISSKIPCSVAIRAYVCLEIVEVVHKCGHIVISPCSQKMSAVCTHPCENRLNCGHNCDKRCHKDDDPQHKQYLCNRPCARMNQDCSACHRCPLLCYEKCKPCSKSVTKMQACGHWSRMLCSTNPLSMPCQQDCFRTLKCGHKCNRLCRGPCGPCSIMVDKIVPECGHSVLMACSTLPTKQLCVKQCTSILPCGHPCKRRCYEECSASKCKCQQFWNKLFIWTKNIFICCYSFFVYQKCY